MSCVSMSRVKEGYIQENKRPCTEQERKEGREEHRASKFARSTSTQAHALLLPRRSYQLRRVPNSWRRPLRASDQCMYAPNPCKHKHKRLIRSWAG